jgi:hypothetical protein
MSNENAKVGKPVGLEKSGGRQKGTPNKKTQDLLNKAEELGVDPFEILLFYAKRDWEALGFESPEIEKAGKDGQVFYEDRITAKMQMDAASEACQYLFPKRKAVEHDIKGDQSHTHKFEPEVLDILSDYKDLISKALNK